jgi:hypothetical protein
MTVSVGNGRSEVWVADGSNRNWPYPFKVLTADHVRLKVTAPSGTVSEVATGFTVLNVGEDAGGAVIYPIAPAAALASGTKVQVLRRVPLTQPNRIGNQGGFHASTHEDTFDLLVMQTQQLDQDAITRQAETLQQVDERLDAHSIVISGAAEYATRTVAQAADIAGSVSFLRTAGYAAPGDGGGALYKKVAAPNSPKPWHIQTANGAWWEYVSGERGVNVRALGASGDGATDDRAAIQAAVDLAAERQKAVYIPASPAAYRIGGPIVIAKAAEITLQGDGWNLSQIGGKAGYAGNYITFGDADPTAGIMSRISDLGFIGPISGTVGSAIRAMNANTAVFERLLFQSVQTGVDLASCFAVTFRDCTWDVTPSTAIYSSTGAHNLVVDDCHFYSAGGSTGQCIRLDGVTDNIVIQNSDFEYCASVLQATNLTAVRITGNYIEYCVNPEFYFSGTARGVVIENNWIALRQGGLTSTYDNIAGGRFVNNTLYNQKIAWGAAIKDFDVGPNHYTGTSTLAPSPFTRVTSFQNTYTATDSTNHPVGYRRDQNGAVELRGQISGGASSAGNVAFNLPIGYRPEKRVYAMGVNNSGAVALIIIDINGNVVPQGIGSGANLRLDCIRFMAGN